MNVTDLKTKRREASTKSRIVKCPIQHEVLRREVIRLTQEIKASQS